MHIYIRGKKNNCSIITKLKENHLANIGNFGFSYVAFLDIFHRMLCHYQLSTQVVI